MGTPPVCAILFTYAMSVGTPVWAYLAWCKWIGASIPPWHEDFSDSKFTDSDLVAMRKFVDVYKQQKTPSKQAAFLESRKDTHSRARHAVLQWFTDAWKQAKLNDEVDKILQTHERLPHQLGGRATKAVRISMVRETDIDLCSFRVSPRPILQVQRRNTTYWN